MQQNNLIAPIIVAIGVIIAAVAFAVVTTLLESADSGADLRLTRLEEAFDAEAAQRARLEAEIGTLKAEDGPIGAMGRSITTLRSIAIDPKFTPLGTPV